VFTKEDRLVIRQSLLQQGRKLFLRYGLRKTSVSELARAAGIAKGTFYHFFDSKEELCLEIFHLEESDLSRGIQEILERHPDATEALRAVMEYSLRFVRGDSLLSRLRESGEMPAPWRREGLAHLARDVEFAGRSWRPLRRKGGLPLGPVVWRSCRPSCFWPSETDFPAVCPAMKHPGMDRAHGQTGREPERRPGRRRRKDLSATPRPPKP
jgi:AcrR family transcriptional regulator